MGKKKGRTFKVQKAPPHKGPVILTGSSQMIELMKTWGWRRPIMPAMPKTATGERPTRPSKLLVISSPT